VQAVHHPWRQHQVLHADARMPDYWSISLNVLHDRLASKTAR
jgi:hypothetical protein